MTPLRPLGLATAADAAISHTVQDCPNVLSFAIGRERGGQVLVFVMIKSSSVQFDLIIRRNRQTSLESGPDGSRTVLYFPPGPILTANNHSA